MEWLRWVALAVAAFVLLLAVSDLPVVRGTTRNGELIGDCIEDKGGKRVDSADALRFAREDVTTGRMAELGGTTLNESDEVAVRLAPITDGQHPYELVVVAKKPFNALVRPENIRTVVNDPGSFPLVAYLKPADDARGKRFWGCVDEAREKA